MNKICIKCQLPTSNKTRPGEITKAVANALENQIRCRPEYWLWSHNRWKHLHPERVKEIKEKMPVRLMIWIFKNFQ